MSQKRAKTTVREGEVTKGCFDVTCGFTTGNLQKFKRHIQEVHRYSLSGTSNSKYKYLSNDRQTFLCVACRILFPTAQKYQQHNGKAWRTHKKISELAQFEELSEIQPNYFVQPQKIDNRLAQHQAVSIRTLNPYIKRYLQANNMDTVETLADFSQRLNSFGISLARARVLRLQWEDLKKGGSHSQWAKFLHFPSEIFSPQLPNITATWDQQRRQKYAKLVKKLKSKDKRFSDVYVPNIASKKITKHRTKFNISYISFLSLIKNLYLSKDPQSMHLAVSLYALAIIGIRSTDYEMFNSINFEDKYDPFIHNYCQNKTKVIAYAPFTFQLLEMIRQISWKGISQFEINNLKRISKWFGTTIYALRRMAFLTRCLLIQAVDLDKIKQLSGHKSAKGIAAYVQSSQTKQMEKLLPSIARIYNIPNLIGAVGPEYYIQDSQLLSGDRYHLPRSWWKAYNKIYKKQISLIQVLNLPNLPYLELNQQQDSNQDQMSSNSQMDVQQYNVDLDKQEGTKYKTKSKINEMGREIDLEQNYPEIGQFQIIPVPQLDVIQSKSDNKIKKNKEKENKKKMKQGVRMKYTAEIGKIIQIGALGQQMRETSEQPIKIILEQFTQYEVFITGGQNHTQFAFTPHLGFSVLPFTMHVNSNQFACAYCSRALYKYDDNGYLLDQFCLCWNDQILRIFDYQIQYSGRANHDSSSILVPGEYLSKQKPIDQIILKVFLAWRGFHYIKSIMPAFSSMKKFQFNRKHFYSHQLENWSRYCQQYFPPITLGVIEGMESGDHGTEVGLFATKRIQKNVLIGQYAADIVKKRFGWQIRRLDSVFQIGQQYLIGPIQRCGYVPLINQPMAKQRANCRAISILYNQNRLPGIFIVTSRAIQPKEELLYKYGGSFTRKEKS